MCWQKHWGMCDDGIRHIQDIMGKQYRWLSIISHPHESTYRPDETVWWSCWVSFDRHRHADKARK